MKRVDYSDNEYRGYETGPGSMPLRLWSNGHRGDSILYQSVSAGTLLIAARKPLVYELRLA